MSGYLILLTVLSALILAFLAVIAGEALARRALRRRHQPHIDSEPGRLDMTAFEQQFQERP